MWAPCMALRAARCDELDVFVFIGFEAFAEIVGQQQAVCHHTADGVATLQVEAFGGAYLPYSP